MEDTRNLHLKGKVLEVARKKSQKHHKMCVPLVTIDLGSFEVLSDHIDTIEHEVDEPSQENHRNDATAATCFLVQEDR